MALCRRPRFGLCHAWKNVQCFSRTKGMVDERIGQVEIGMHLMCLEEREELGSSLGVNISDFS